MESWLIADRETLSAYFGKDFRDSALPAKGRSIETVPKSATLEALVTATKDCKAHYNKGSNSFDILAQIDPAKVTVASPWAATFVQNVGRAMAG